MPKKEVKQAASKSRLLGVYNKILDQVEKKYSLDSSDLERQRFSTGLLAFDLMVGGGLSSGLTVCSGQEASGKSTFSAHVVKSAMNVEIPIVELRDCEGSTDEIYTRNILNVDSLRDVFGQKVKGIWKIPPRVRYYDSNVLEKTFESLIHTANKLPDKIYRAEDKQWYYVLSPRDKRTADFEDVLGSPIAKLKQQTGRLWFPCENPYPQMVAVIDSFPSMISETMDEQETKGKGMAFAARAYAEILPRIVGKLRPKHLIILGINQIREKPAVMYGSPFYEPGGNTLKHAANCRNQFWPRAVPESWRGAKGNSNICVEKSILGDSYDEFSFKLIRNSKNKFGAPYLECWSRVWMKDCNGEGRGFDLAFDAWQGMQLSGLATEERKKGEKYLQFNKELPKPLEDLNKKRIAWTDFKPLIHAKEFDDREIKDLAEKICKKNNLNSKMNIRSRLGKLINSTQLSYHPITKSKD